MLFRKGNMIRSIQESPLYKISNPDSITFFGASNNFDSMGSNLLASPLALGFKGPIYPIHRTEDRILNLNAYRSVFDLPETPDLAVLVLPAPIVCQALDECGQKGIRHAVVISGGFKEVGDSGAELEKELLKVAGKYGIRFIGPNCIGVSNQRHRLNTTPLPYQNAPGFIGMASQSGSFITQIYNHLNKLNLGFSTAFSVGNEADIDIVDCMEYLGACPHTKVIALYIESIRRGREFLRVAREVVPHKPVVALYPGGTEEGGRAGLSHTGAMAGPDPLYNGIFQQSGVVRARSVTELFDFCLALGNAATPAGNRVVIQTGAGGPGATAADACGRAGLKLPSLSPETIEQLSSLTPDTASINNPVDFTFHRGHMDFYRIVPRILLESKNTDMLLIYFLLPLEMIKRMIGNSGVPDEKIHEEAVKFIEGQCRAVVDLIEESDKPVVGYTFLDPGELFVRRLLELGVPVLPGSERAARALGAMVQYAELRKKILCCS